MDQRSSGAPGAPQPTAAPAAPEQPLFDVFVSLPPQADLELIQQRAVADAGIVLAQIELVLRTLKSVPSVRIGASVSRERADKAKLRFTRAGLLVEVNPVLQLAPKTESGYDGRMVCPACGVRVLVTEDRRCPECEVYVDKVDKSVLLRKKIREQEQARIAAQLALNARQVEVDNDESMEATIRNQIREELEAQYGLNRANRWLGGKWGPARGLAVLGLVGVVAFAAGKKLDFAFIPTAVETASEGGMISSRGISTVDMMRLLKLARAQAGGDGGSAGGDEVEGAAGAQAEGGQNDSLVRVAQQSQGSGSPYMEVAEAMLTGGMAGSGPAGSATGIQASAASAVAPGLAASAPALVLYPRDQSLLTVTLALNLVEMGQRKRAREVIDALASAKLPGDDLALQRAVRGATLIVQAHELQDVSPAQRSQAMARLRTALAAVDDVPERSALQAKVGAILARQGGESAAAGLTLLTQSGEMLRGISLPAERTTATADWLVATGELMLAEQRDHAAAGRWVRVSALNSQLDSLRAQATTPQATLRLLALQYQSRRISGEPQAAQEVAGQALSLIETAHDPLTQARWLRDWLGRSAAMDSPAAAALVAKLGQEAMAAQRPDLLVELALIEAEAGRVDAYHAWRAKLAALPGGATPERQAQALQLAVAGDLARGS
ncbi:hypothetical protein, partial [Ideonella sp.]|uniref:hypothetical protein n=1 Tax=Ideonella sp. TaxID=1929293 RepID=UPI003BB65662